MMSQYRFINFNKYMTVMGTIHIGDIDTRDTGYFHIAYLETEVTWEISVPSS